MKRKAWLLLAVVPVLIAAYAVKRSVIPAPVRGGEASVRQPARLHSSPKPSREPGTVTASGSTAQEPAVTGRALADFDPFALLDKQYEAQRIATTTRFDEAEASIWARVQPALDASDAKYRRDLEGLEKTALNGDQKTQWNKQYGLQYEKARLEIKRTIEPDLDELAVKRKGAFAELESDRAQKRTRLQEIQALAEKGELDPIAAKQTQFELLGINLPASAFQPPEARPVPAGAEAAPPKGPTPTVEAIVATADDRFCALIGDALVYEGSTVQGYRVRKIQADSVEFEKDGQTWVQKVD